jgi:hypothetical protein
MLRMYECNWCGERQTKDSDSIRIVQAGDRMATQKVGYCYTQCHGALNKNYRTIMRPMTKDKFGDWKYGDGSDERNRVEPPLVWH